MRDRRDATDGETRMLAHERPVSARSIGSPSEARDPRLVDATVAGGNHQHRTPGRTALKISDFAIWPTSMSKRVRGLLRGARGDGQLDHLCSHAGRFERVAAPAAAEAGKRPPSLDRQAARDLDHGAVDVRSVVRGEEGVHIGDVFRRAKPPQGHALRASAPAPFPGSLSESMSR